MVLTASAGGKKRKNDENTPVAVPMKKARTLKDGAHSAVAVLVDTILANPKACAVPSGDEAVRSILVDIALYARALEQQEPPLPPAIANPTASSSATTSVAVVATAKSLEQLKEEAETIRRTAQAGIIKQMGWKPTCNTGRTKWCYDGFCPDPEVFGVLMGLGGPPKFSIQKIKTDEFTKLMGGIEGSVRYASLYITSPQVTVRWIGNGEFKFNGLYGKYQSNKTALR
ncbi:hypothetical protein TRAPUB_9999 [Trametes pubescens]|uniref:Uncharacterized protein n=1 Tax=Trametes pubescens TaxID=154538 RepID=A0A1M2W0S2_TRAPU|nr:hypothetical protein TRAPUB_9999 [Trametes pubescens]